MPFGRKIYDARCSSMGSDFNINPILSRNILVLYRPGALMSLRDSLIKVRQQFPPQTRFWVIFLD
jgi:hypothetical protein